MNKKVIIIIILVLLIAVIGGVAYYFMVMKQPKFVQIKRTSIEGGWYPYGSTKTLTKSEVGSDLASVIKYANKNGYSAFAFNENPSATDTANVENNRNILFFKEANINTSTFFTEGVVVPGFKVYAAEKSKLTKV